MASYTQKQQFKTGISGGLINVALSITKCFIFQFSEHLMKLSNPVTLLLREENNRRLVSNDIIGSYTNWHPIHWSRSIPMLTNRTCRPFCHSTDLTFAVSLPLILKNIYFLSLEEPFKYVPKTEQLMKAI